MAEEAKTTSTGPTRPNKPLGKPKRLVALRTCTYRFEDGARTKLYRGVAPQWLSTKQVEELVRYKLLKEE